MVVGATHKNGIDLDVVFINRNPVLPVAAQNIAVSNGEGKFIIDIGTVGHIIVIVKSSINRDLRVLKNK